jgi:hypothetical protein
MPLRYSTASRLPHLRRSTSDRLDNSESLQYKLSQSSYDCAPSVAVNLREHSACELREGYLRSLRRAGGDGHWKPVAPARNGRADTTLTPPSAQHAATAGNLERGNRLRYADSAPPCHTRQQGFGDCGSGGRGFEPRRSPSCKKASLQPICDDRGSVQALAYLANVAQRIVRVRYLAGSARLDQAELVTVLILEQRPHAPRLLGRLLCELHTPLLELIACILYVVT